METTITVRNGQVSDDIQKTIRNKVSKLPKFYDRTTGIQVIVDLQRTDNPKVEVIVSAEEASDFFAADNGSNVLVALDSVMDKMERQLRKHKEKLKGHRHRETKHTDVSE